MSKVGRNNPVRSTASDSRYTLLEFERGFPDDAAFLEYLAGQLHPESIFCRLAAESRSTTGRRRGRCTPASSAGTGSIRWVVRSSKTRLHRCARGPTRST